MEGGDHGDHVIDECTMSEWYTAKVFAKLFSGSFRYDGIRKWSYWDVTEKQWVHDENRDHIRGRLRYDLSQRVLQRAKYWQQQVAAKQVTDLHTAGLMIQRLLTISQKLQTDAFLRKVLRELQEYYC